MSVVSLDILGFRGFSHEQTLCFAQPNGKTGSGLTILVGPNNGGKSTIVESLQAISSHNVSFSEGKRNKKAGDRVTIRAKTDIGDVHELRTVDSGGSNTVREPDKIFVCFVQPSRRYFGPYFGNGRGGAALNRKSFLEGRSVPGHRSSPLNDFPEGRLFDALLNKGKFNAVFSKVLDPVPDWTIDQSEQETSI